MGKKELMDLLIQRAKWAEDAIKLEESEIFALGTNAYRQIHIASWRWDEVVEILQPEVTYNPDWSDMYDDVEASFHINLLGNDYKVFALLDKGAGNGK